MIRLYRYFILLICFSFQHCGYLHYQSYLEDLFQKETSNSQNIGLLSFLIGFPHEGTRSNQYLEFTKAELNLLEGFQGDSFGVRLKLAPTEKVLLELQTETLLEINGISYSLQLEFTPENWNEFQTVTVNAPKNILQDGTINTIITHNLISSDSVFLNSSPFLMYVTILDSDGAGVALSKTSLYGAEGGATDQYNISLTSPPTSDVTITLTPSQQIQINGPLTLVFSNSNWNQSQTIFVLAVNDTLVEGAHSGIITHTVTSDDFRFSHFVLADVTFWITDNDPPINLSQVAVERTNITGFTVGGQTNYWVTSPGQTIPFLLSFQITSSCNVSCSVPFLVGIYGTDRLGTSPDTRACRSYNDASPHPKNNSFNDSLSAPEEPGIYMITIWRNSSGSCAAWGGGAGMLTNYRTQGVFIGVIEVVSQ